MPVEIAKDKSQHKSNYHLQNIGKLLPCYVLLTHYHYPNRQQLYASLCHLLRPKGVYDIGSPFYMCPLPPWTGSCENEAGGITGGDKQQGTRGLWCVVHRCFYPRASSMSSSWLAARHLYSTGAIYKEMLTMLSASSAFPVPSPPSSIYLSWSWK